MTFFRMTNDFFISITQNSHGHIIFFYTMVLHGKKITYLLFSFIDLKENNEMNANKKNVEKMS